MKVVPLDFDRNHLPDEFVGKGWGRAHRLESDGPYYLGPGKRFNEIWAIESLAEIHFRVPEEPGKGLPHFVLELRAPQVPGAEDQVVTIRLGEECLGEFTVGAADPEAKLVLLPEASRGSEVSLQLTFRKFFSISEAFAGDVELSAAVQIARLCLHRDEDAFLSRLQEEYDRIRTLRDELFDRGLEKLGNRGELLDQVSVALEHLERLPEDTALAREALEGLFEDPYVRGACSQEPAFDEVFYRDRFADLRDGVVLQHLRRWEHLLKTYHRAVVQLSNRAFLALGDQRPEEMPIPLELEPLLRGEVPIDRSTLLALKERNDMLNTLEVLLRRDELQSVMPDLEIEMSSYCNLACAMCGRSWHTFQFKQQTDAQLLKIAPVLPYIRHVTIAGVGENTTSDRLNLFARLCEIFHVDSRIFTNGLLIHRQLDTLSRFSKVCVSFDGGTAESLEAQRRGSNFQQILRGVRMLRERAPSKELAFSVVVSRVNLDELPRIAEIAVEHELDHVAFSPVWHDSPLALRPSDRAVFETRLEEARRIATAGGVALQVNFGAEDFEVTEDAPRDREGILSWLHGLEFPSNRTDSWDELRETFRGLTFPYHPDASLFPGGKLPDPPTEVRRIRPCAVPVPLSFDLETALRVTEERIAAAEAELRESKGDLTLPYCLSIWKYTYTRSNGKNRLCPQAFTDVGNVAVDGYQEVTNSAKNRHYRRTMFGGELEDSCKTCLDPYRRWGHDVVAQQVKSLGFQVKEDLSRYSERHS